jgi:hypothetical protein
VNCETTKSILQDYLERRLVQLDRNEFLRHINECTSCERELVNFRDVFTFLGSMEAVEPPRRFQNDVISQLKSEGYVHEPKVKPVRRWVAGFLGLPGVAKYPLAAAVVIAALYLPLKLAFGLAGGAAGKATVIATNLLVTLRDTLGEASFLASLWNVLDGYARAFKTVLSASLSLLSSSSDSLLLLAGAGVVALSAILVITRHVKKRSSQNAPLCL